LSVPPDLPHATPAPGPVPASAHPADKRHRAPIGVFDSGVGGLSVLREIRALLPAETLHYIADSGHAPYGEKSPAQVQALALRLVQQLVAQGCKAVVVACNTVTGLAIQPLREACPQIPLVAIEPAVKPAAAATQTGVIGVLATRNTVHSAGLARLIERHAQGVQVLAQACPGWVEQVERGELDSPATEALVRERVQPVLDAGADMLVLGCTHYPFLRPLIERIAGPAIRVLDPAQAVARELQRRLAETQLLNPAETAGQERFWTSGDVVTAQRVIQTLWPHSVQVAPL